MYTQDDFIALFLTIAVEKHRYTVFSDFITMMAVTLYNQGVYKDEKREQEYLAIIHKYNKEDQHKFPELFAIVVDLLDQSPTDHLGELYMSLGFSEVNKGQFFTPPEISILMSKILNMSDVLALAQKQPFVTLGDPACGAGGMFLAAVKDFIQAGLNPATHLWVQGIDIDRITALMCYIQLSLWNVPGEVIVGDSLKEEYREIWHTPAHVWYDWPNRFKLTDMIGKFKEVLATLDERPVTMSEQAERREATEVTLETFEDMVQEEPIENRKVSTTPLSQEFTQIDLDF